MKAIILLTSLIFLINLGTASQTPILSEVITVDSTLKDELYDRAKIWFIKTFESSKDVIQLDDKELGKIIGKGSIKYTAAAFSPGTIFSGYFNFLLIVECKDKKFRYSFENINHSADKDDFSCGSFENELPAGGKTTVKAWTKMKTQGYESIMQIAQNLKAEMLIKPKKNEW